MLRGLGGDQVTQLVRDRLIGGGNCWGGLGWVSSRGGCGRRRRCRAGCCRAAGEAVVAGAAAVDAAGAGTGAGVAGAATSSSFFDRAAGAVAVVSSLISAAVGGGTLAGSEPGLLRRLRVRLVFLSDRIAR